MTAQILLHPKLPQVVSLIDVVRKFNALGYQLSNTKARNIEAVPAVTIYSECYDQCHGSGSCASADYGHAWHVQY